LLVKYGPYLKNTYGIGIKPTVRKASSDTAQSKPSRLIMGVVNNMKAPDSAMRINVLVARTDAP
jgi:hypothetical protein